ncbi:LysR substrate-binding domain-containing protein [Variovorax sp. GB1P17]|uniref:LysR substrate-binding domain-containing protein n=1 Tax=Variovorax sp. GB1P17 TaxID=3443740 RepID=UPI003F48A55E
MDDSRPAHSGGPSARLELRHLRYFRAVAEELSFTRAADRLHIAQPPLSQQIRQLEEELGVHLIDRDNRPLRLTEAGALLLERTVAVMSQLDASVEDVRRIGRGQSGKLSIGFAGSAMYSVLPDILNAYRDACPGVELAFSEMLAAEIADALSRRVIDVGFSRPGLAADDSIEQRLLVTEPLMAAVPTRHALAAAATVPIADLQGQVAILYPRHPKPSLTDLILQELGAHGVALEIRQEAPNMQTALGLVAAGVGITFVPASVCQQGRSGVRFMSIEPQVLTSPMTMVWRRHQSSVALTHFVRVVESLDAPAS